MPDKNIIPVKEETELTEGTDYSVFKFENEIAKGIVITSHSDKAKEIFANSFQKFFDYVSDCIKEGELL